MMEKMKMRPRRNRSSNVLRNMLAETSLSASDLIMPLFLQEGSNVKTPILSMPGHFRYSLDQLLKKIDLLLALGVESIALFPCVDSRYKDSTASFSYDENCFYLKGITEIKKRFPRLVVISDVAMDPYSSDGHDGLVASDGTILNDESLTILSKMALAQAQAGVDMIGPSDMMDGRVGRLRDELDSAGHQQVGIISYTAKYASHFYGPFREALDSAPKSGDKKSYQMDYRNVVEALREAHLDVSEGADILMVKPGLAYLDIICRLKENVHLPIAAYNVSGEFAMVKAADQQGWIDGTQVMMESLYAFKRAGASVILSYFAEEAAEFLKCSSF